MRYFTWVSLKLLVNDRRWGDCFDLKSQWGGSSAVRFEFVWTPRDITCYYFHLLDFHSSGKFTYDSVFRVVLFFQDVCTLHQVRDSNKSFADFILNVFSSVSIFTLTVSFRKSNRSYWLYFYFYHFLKVFWP